MRSFRALLGRRKPPPPMGDVPVLSFSETRLNFPEPSSVPFAHSARLMDEPVASSSTTVIEEDDDEELECLRTRITPSPSPMLDAHLARIGEYTCVGHIEDYPHIIVAKRKGRSSYVIIKSQQVLSPRSIAAKYQSIHEVTISKMLSDVRLCGLLGHANVVQFVDHTPCFRSNVHLMVLAHCSAGSLFNFMNGIGKHISTRQKIGLAQDITEGMRYVHSLNVAHRDIKHENLFLDYDRVERRYVVKIGDFGSSIIATNDSTYTHKPGSACYAAPELFMLGKYSPLPADVWAYGVSLYVLFERRYPFKVETGEGVIRHDPVTIIVDRLGELDMHDKFAERLVGTLLNSIFQYEPERRPTMAMIDARQFFASLAEPLTRAHLAALAAAKGKT